MILVGGLADPYPGVNLIVTGGRDVRSPGAGNQGVKVNSARPAPAAGSVSSQLKRAEVRSQMEEQ